MYDEDKLEKIFNSFTEHFMTAKDIADLIKVKERTIWQYKSNGKLPRPFGFVDNKPIWSKGEIFKWCRENPKLSQIISIIKI